MSCSSSPDHKKRRTKADADVDTPSEIPSDAPSKSWRSKSFEQFGLKEGPDASVNGSDEAWKRYYEYRTGVEQEDIKDMNNKRDDGMLDLLKEWKAEMAKLLTVHPLQGDLQWSFTPKLVNADWEEDEAPFSRTCRGHIYSPFYARILQVTHFHLHRGRIHGVVHRASWEYKLIDFEDEDSVRLAKESREEGTDLCFTFDDEEIEEEDTQVENLSQETCDKLRLFIFGSASEESKKSTCSDLDFWRLLFGSCGSTSLSREVRGGTLGHYWNPDREVLAKQGIHLDKNKCYGCSWLEHRVMEITGNLDDILKHYEPPKPNYQKRPVRKLDLNNPIDFMMAVVHGLGDERDY